MLGLSFSSKLSWGVYIVSIAQTVSRKVGALVRFMKFLSRDVANFFYKPTIRPFMEHYFHVWVDAPSCYLDMLDKL